MPAGRRTTLLSNDARVNLMMPTSLKDKLDGTAEELKVSTALLCRVALEEGIDAAVKIIGEENAKN